MFLIFALAAVHVGFIIYPGAGNFQTEQDSIYCERLSTHIVFDFAGMPVLSGGRVMDWRPPFRTFELIKSEEVQKELELVPNQIDATDSFLSQFQKRRTDLGKKSRLGASVSKEYDEECIKLKRDIDFVLLPFQKERIEELYWQVTLRRFGVEPLINEYLQLSGSQLTNEHKHEIDRITKQMAEAWADEVKKRCSAILEAYENTMPDQFQAEFSALIATNPDYANLDLLDLTSQRFLSRLESVNEEKGRDRTLADRLSQSEYYVLEADGQWKLHSSVVSFDGALLGWIVDPEKSQLLDLELTDLQLDQLLNLTRDIRMKIDEKTEAVNNMYDNKIDEKKIRTFLDQGNKDVNDFATQQFFEEILLPHQHKALGERLNRLEADKCGPFALSVRLDKLSDKHRNQFIDSVNELRKTILAIHNESSDFERKLLAKLDKIDSSVATRLQEMIGPKPKHLGFSWFLFLTTYKISSRSIGN